MPQMAAYPPSRIEKSSPFTYTGLDYLGPLYVKENSESVTYKVCVCLFTCLAVRAVQLELINDMSAEQFLPVPKKIYCPAWQAERDHI